MRSILEAKLKAIETASVRAFLMESHRRFNLGLYLQTVGGLQPFVRVWLLKRR